MATRPRRLRTRHHLARSADGWGGPRLGRDECWRRGQRVVARSSSSVQESLGTLAENCPENFRGPWLLISAEMARSRGDVAEAVRHADEAVRLARETDNRQLEALANEVGARIRLGRGDEREAVPLLTEAIRCYTEWGAVGEGCASRIATPACSGTARVVPPTGGRRVTAFDPTMRVSLDMATVLKLARSHRRRNQARRSAAQADDDCDGERGSQARRVPGGARGRLGGRSRGGGRPRTCHARSLGTTRRDHARAAQRGSVRAPDGTGSRHRSRRG